MISIQQHYLNNILFTISIAWFQRPNWNQNEQLSRFYQYKLQYLCKQYKYNKTNLDFVQICHEKFNKVEIHYEDCYKKDESALLWVGELRDIVFQ